MIIFKFIYSDHNQSVSETASSTNGVVYSLESTSSGVCITCTFLDSSATDCVAVVHQRISQISSSGLINIESSHRFTRSGDTASGCIEAVNIDDYQVGVLEGRQEDQPAMTGIIGTITIILVSYVYLGCYYVEITIFNVVYINFYHYRFFTLYWMHCWFR